MEELRVGVCGCIAEKYQGTLDGKELTLHQLRDEALETPLTFVVKEIVLPANEYHGDDLRENWCQAFVDADPTSDGRYSMEIMVCGWTPKDLKEGRPEEINSVTANFWTSRKKLPSSRFVLSKLERTLSEALNRVALPTWKEYTTPTAEP